MRKKVKAERLRFPLLGERVRVRGIFSPAGLSCAKVSRGRGLEPAPYLIRG